MTFIFAYILNIKQEELATFFTLLVLHGKWMWQVQATLSNFDQAGALWLCMLQRTLQLFSRCLKKIWRKDLDRTCWRMVHGDCYVTFILYLHRTLAHPSPWNSACYIMITVDRGSTSTILFWHIKTNVYDSGLLTDHGQTWVSDWQTTSAVLRNKKCHAPSNQLCWEHFSHVLSVSCFQFTLFSVLKPRLPRN